MARAASLCVAVALAVVVASATTAAAAVRKCCPPAQALTSAPALVCIPGGSQTLMYHADVGLPANCSTDLTVVPATQDVQVDCIDVLQDDRGQSSLVGVVCDDDSEKFFVPEVNFVRKCCPPNRRYSNFREGCWKTDFPDADSTVDLLRLMFLNDTSSVVNLAVGAPTCSQGYVLKDVFLHHRHVWRQESESILLKHQGPSDILMIPEDFCVDLITENDYSLVVRSCQDARVACDSKRPCINKCCADGASYKNFACSDTKFKFDVQFYSLRPVKPPDLVFIESIGIAYNAYNKSFFKCQNGRYNLNPMKSPEDAFFVTQSGQLFVPEYPVNMRLIDWKDFCLERLGQSVIPFLCFRSSRTFQGTQESLHFRLIAYGLLVSSLFLLITLLVYALLPSLHNLHGQTLMCHVASLLAAYSFLVSSQLLSGMLPPPLCRAISYGIQFFFLAAFSWLNVICFDIWWTFGAIKSHVGKAEESRRKLLRYSLYAWLLPLAITASTYLVDTYRLLPDTFLPKMGERFCWFTRDTHGKTVFFNLPVMVQIFSNVIFFALTSQNCSRIKSELREMQHNSNAKLRYHADINKLTMNTKLFVVMGLTWACEIITWYFQENSNSAWWYILDAANIFQGFFIFLIFVIKKNVMRAMKLRIHEVLPSCFEPLKQRPNTSSTVFTTVASSDSRSSASERK